jgi:hypothetical protein
MNLSYSKKGSSLPITNTKIEDSSPCMKPAETSTGFGKYYPTEKHEAYGECSEAKLNGFTFDGRF